MVQGVGVVTMQVEDQARTIDALEKENLLLKAMMGDGKAALMSQPPQAQIQQTTSQPPAQAPSQSQSHSQHASVSPALPPTSTDLPSRQ